MTGEAKPFRMAQAAGSDWRETLARCLAELPEGGGETLGFVYVGDAFAGDLAAIAETLREETGVPDWLGTVGLGICATGQEYFDAPAIAVMLCDLPSGSYRIVETGETPGRALDDAATAWSETKRPPFGVVHVDPRNPQAAELVDDLSAASGAFLVGGLASSRAGHPQIAGRMTEGAVSGVLFSDQVAVATGLSQGCAPIGDYHEITASERNVIESLDGRPALEVFMEDIGDLLSRDLARAAGYIHAALPTAGSDTGDYTVRNLVGIDRANGDIAIGALVESGDRVMFVRRDGQAARDDLRRMLQDLRRRCGGAPRGGLYFTCLARGPNLFGPDSEELGILREELGEVPLVGFFCNGEVSHDRVYGYTGVLALFL
ncbi:MAG: histidine kinase [Rhodospirillaceae bacterium]|jgi:small ligand-binding sensory domain FIST|nr:histidine kinase [Rhodospirillaceae bacterium]MBT6117419.1 histidine kinase [Rhodospirillaceae bacterium]